MKSLTWTDCTPETTWNTRLRNLSVDFSDPAFALPAQTWPAKGSQRACATLSTCMSSKLAVEIQKRRLSLSLSLHGQRLPTESMVSTASKRCGNEADRDQQAPPVASQLNLYAPAVVTLTRGGSPLEANLLTRAEFARASCVWCAANWC